VLDVAVPSQKVSMQASYHMVTAGTLELIDVPEYRFGHLAPVYTFGENSR
jgi:hypothetical protein